MDLYVERVYPAPQTPADVLAGVDAARPTLAACRVHWRDALLARGGHRVLCRVSAPDIAAVRRAFRELGHPLRGIWATDAPSPADHQANVALERHRSADDGDLGSGPNWCLATHRVRYAGAIVSLDRQRVIELFEAPDAESVRLARGASGARGDRVWAFEQLTGHTHPARSPDQGPHPDRTADSGAAGCNRGCNMR
jgi:hypothetical protein